MSVSPPVSDKDDFIAILSAVMETERGRWFLAEFARRNRHAETDRVLAAIARLEAAMAPPLPTAEPQWQPTAAPVPAPPAPPAPTVPSLSAAPPAPPAAQEICVNDNALSAIDALSVDARLRMFR